MPAWVVTEGGLTLMSTRQPTRGLTWATNLSERNAFNPLNVTGRTNGDIAHEISHILLNH